MSGLTSNKTAKEQNERKKHWEIINETVSQRFKKELEGRDERRRKRNSLIEEVGKKAMR